MQCSKIDSLAIDVALLPPPDVSKRALEINRSLSKIDLSKDLPHISLAMGCIKKDSIPEIDSILKKENFSIPLRVTKISSIQNFSVFEIEATREIQALHERIMRKLSPFLHYKVTPDMFASPVNDFTINYVKNYYANKFYPHITLGFGEVKERIVPFSFYPSKLVLCHLGNYCTCGEVILSY